MEKRIGAGWGLALALAFTLLALCVGCNKKRHKTVLPPPAPIKYHSMNFGATLSFYAGDPNDIGLAEILAQLSALEETGCEIIRIDMPYDCWENGDAAGIATIDAIVQQIKDDGKKLMLADEGYGAWNNSATWNEFKTLHSTYVQTFMLRYQPDFYLVIKEPWWYAEYQIAEASTPRMWYDLTVEDCDLVKSIDPATKTAVAIYPDGKDDATGNDLDNPYFKMVAYIANLDIMGIDWYNENDLLKSRQFLIGYVPASKELWIPECWRGDAFFTDSDEEDALWLKRTLRLALDPSLAHEVTGYIPFYTHLFSSDSIYNYKGIDYANVRTHSFYAFKLLVEEVNSRTPILDWPDTQITVAGSTWTNSETTTYPNPSSCYGKGFFWSPGGDGSNEVTWTPIIPETENYSIFVWYPSAPAVGSIATDAPFTISYASGSEVVRIDQNVGGGAWQLLGTYKFTQGLSGTVTLSNAANGSVLADAVRLVKE